MLSSLQEEEELPPSTTTGPDAKGIVTKVEYFRNEKGEVMKKTTKTRVVKIEKKVYKVRPGLGIALAQMPASQLMPEARSVDLPVCKLSACACRVPCTAEHRPP